MDEYLSEDEKLAHLTGWLRANIPWILLGLAAGGLVVGGWRWWQSRVDSTGIAAAQSYAQVLDAFAQGDRTRGLDLVQQLGEKHPGSPYVDQADLAAAPAAAGDGSGRPRRLLSHSGHEQRP